MQTQRFYHRNSKQYFLWIAVAASVAVGIMPAFAGPTAEKLLKKMDQDGDGEIAHYEWTGESLAFDRTDTDKNGRLSYEELVSNFGSGKKKGRKSKK